MYAFPKHLFFLTIVRPLLSVILGLNVRHRERLPVQGPAILVANHNSHLDSLALMSLLPWRLLPRVQPVAAADYFLQGRLLSWVSRHLIGIIPLQRRADGRSLDERLAGVYEALDRGQILILFPEGSRGEPERLSQFKSGIAHVARRYAHVPIVPIFLHGFGKALPKGESVLVPFFCDVIVGESLPQGLDAPTFMQVLELRMQDLAAEGNFQPWE
jgi:1-acyl-sn-glycerol-3-phosphate acyltransferase